MASLTDYRDIVKRRFRVLDTSLDTEIEDSVKSAIPLLAPYVRKKGIEELSANSTDQSIAFAPSGAVEPDVTRIYVKGSSDVWELFSDYFYEDGIIYFQEWLEDGTTIQVHYKCMYQEADIADVSDLYKTGLADFACAEFAGLLAGDKSKYNMLGQSSGARGVDNMLDLQVHYENQADRHLSPFAKGDGVV